MRRALLRHACTVARKDRRILRPTIPLAKTQLGEVSIPALGLTRRPNVPISLN